MGGNPWRKWLGESDEPGRNRLQAFVYSRLWMGVFPSFLAGFAVIFLICYWGNLPVEKSSNKALLSGLLCVVGYAIGVWDLLMIRARYLQLYYLLLLGVAPSY